MRNIDENNEPWILSIRSKVNSVYPPENLKRKVMEQIEFQNENGDMLASIRIDSYQEDDVMDTIIQNLKPGMGKAIYVADQGKGTVSQQTNYKAVKWENGIKALLNLISPLRLCLPINAELLDISIYYGFDNLSEEEIDDMVSESKVTGKLVIVRDLQPNNVLVGMNLIYRKDGKSFEFRIFNTTKSRIHVPDMEMEKIEYLQIRGNEAVYLTNSGRQHLIWAEEETGTKKALQYELLADSCSRDLLFGIANSITELI